ncbi:MAG: DUF2892 domain-containing protein [Halobacteria archaeon]|nr:DUF2892 domain-containing protein [Halobacteria archaeon]
MEQNVGKADSIVRIVIGAVAGVVSLAMLGGMVQSLPMILSPILGIVAIMMLGTAFTRSCWLYSLLGVDTCEV